MIQLVIGGAPGLAVRLERTSLFSTVHPVSSTSELKSLVSGGVLKVSKNQIAFVFSDSMLVDTPTTSLEVLIAKLATSGFAVIILATSPRGGQILSAAPGAGLLEGPFSVNVLLGALAGTGVVNIPPVDSGFDIMDLISGATITQQTGVPAVTQITTPTTVPVVQPVLPVVTHPPIVEVKPPTATWETTTPTKIAEPAKIKLPSPTGTPSPAGRNLPPPSGAPLLPPRLEQSAVRLPPATPSPLRKLVPELTAWPKTTSKPTGYSAEHTNPTKQTIVLAVGAAKGGVGKSTLSLSLAVRAGLRLRGTGGSVALIDCNYGQSDIGRYMQIFTGPTIVNIAQDRTLLNRAYLDKAMVHRPELNLHVLRGPATLTEGNPMWINAALYNQVVDVMRGMFSVIVLDLPVAEKFLDMYVSFALPQADFLVVPINPNVATLLAVDSWLQNICEPEFAGGNGFDQDRVGLVLNRSKEGVDCDEDDVRHMMARWRLLTAIQESDEWQRANNNGEILAAGANADLNASLDEILYESTGLEEFAPQNFQEVSGKSSLLSRFIKPKSPKKSKGKR